MKEFASTVRSDKIYTQSIFNTGLFLLLHKILQMVGSQIEGARKKIYIQYSYVSYNHLIDATHYDIHKASWKREKTLLNIMTFPSK